MDLEKADVWKSHFATASAHHAAMAEDCQKLSEINKAHAEHYQELMGKAGDDREHHKASAAFHKSAALVHERLHKRHAAHATHLRSVGELLDSEHGNKIAFAAGLVAPSSAAMFEEVFDVPIKSFPVAQRNGGKVAANASPIDYTGIDVELLDLVKVD
jgi:hypothetical protein